MNPFHSNMVRSKGLKVEKKDAEKVKHLLRDQDALDDKKIKNDSGVIFPIKDVKVDLAGIGYEILEDVFEPIRREDAFQAFLRSKGIQLSSYDVIGDIAIFEIPDEQERHERSLAEALINGRKNIKKVYKKSSSVQGEERVRRYEHLGGIRSTETLHREQGCQFKLDISRVFFSPRLSYERQRIKELVNPGERIVDMFAGVGPYAIVIAKERDVTVQGYDINAEAIKYFKMNILLNHVENRVEAYHGDSSKIAPKGWADRVIMNLPKKGIEFYDPALKILKQEGGVVHYYGVGETRDPFNARRLLMEKAKEEGWKPQVSEERIVRSYSPREVHVAIDVEVSR